MTRKFAGVIDLDIRKSTPDCRAFLQKNAPEAALNGLLPPDDDTSLAAWYSGHLPTENATITTLPRDAGGTFRVAAEARDVAVAMARD